MANEFIKPKMWRQNVDKLFSFEYGEVDFRKEGLFAYRNSLTDQIDDERTFFMMQTSSANHELRIEAPRKHGVSTFDGPEQ